MFGIGFPELIIILIVALLVVGPSKLPEVARSVGRALGEFRRMADDVKDSLVAEMDKEDETKEVTPGQSAEQKTPDPYTHPADPTDPKKETPDPHGQKGA
jgi:sec-independent protein translocase protein TatB